MNSLTEIISLIRHYQDEMLSDLARLVNMDSPTREKAVSDRVADVVAELAHREGMQVQIDPQKQAGDNVIARLGTPDRRRGVLLIGHYDTVFPSGEAASRPFRIDGDRAFGPGVFDMKGGLVIGLYSLRAVRQALPDWDLPVTFIFNSDEEDGSWGSRDLIMAEARRHQIALILEPSDAPGGQLITARKGGGSFQMRVEGRESHAGAAPEEGRNAIIEAAHKVVALEALARPDIGTTVSPGVIRGGTKCYVVPGACDIEIDIRVPNDSEQARVEKALGDIVGSVHIRDTRATLSGQFHRPPMVRTAETDRHALLVQEMSRAVDFPLDTGMSGSCSDGNLTANVGVPTLDGLGPHGGRHHSPNEYLELRSLEKKSCILAGYLAELWKAS